MVEQIQEILDLEEENLEQCKLKEDKLLDLIEDLNVCLLSKKTEKKNITFLLKKCKINLNKLRIKIELLF